MTPRIAWIARWVVIAAAAAAVLVAATGRSDPEPSAAEPELVLRYLYSPDAKDLLVPLINRFNGEVHPSGGREIRIDGFSFNSGQAEAALADRREQAVLWTPASSLWGGLLNHSVSDDWVSADNPHLVFSPQVIAIWKDFADALGSRKTRIGWKDILDLATSKRSWADYGHREWGRFKLGHTNPGSSTSGLSAVASEYYAVTGQRSGLDLADVRRPDVRAAVREIEQSIAHYGETAEGLIRRMYEYREPYAHAAYVQETTLLKVNKQQQAPRLVAIEPADGTFVADYPLIVLEAPWVRANERAAAEVFRDWLVPKITPKNANASNFRIRRPTGLVELDLPEPAVLEAIQDAWHADRQPANIVLAVDTSSSMARLGRFAAAKQGLHSFLGELLPSDRIGLVTSGGPKTIVGLGAPESQSAVSRAVDDLFADGNEPVYPAISRALDQLRARNDPNRINAVVVLSDGAGTSVGLEELLGAIEDQPLTEGTSVRIFTVAYGQGRHVEALRQIASASDGAFFPAGPKDIKDVYRTIYSYF
jgi:Ca-activated chloride channel family protein